MRELGSEMSAAYPDPALSFGPLMTLQEIAGGAVADGLGAYDAYAGSCLSAMMRYIVDVLNAPHRDLGRPGVVCPFTTEAVNRYSLLLTASDIMGEEEDRLAAEMGWLRDLFKDAESLFKPSVPDMYRAIIVVFPQLASPTGATMIENVQKALKPSYLERGLMIGEFYPECPAPGLHNPAFRPFQTPVISLAVRHMTLFDAPFMVQDDRYIESYCRRFGESGAKRIKTLLDMSGSTDRTIESAPLRAAAGRTRDA